MAKKESRELTDVLSSSQKKYKPSKEMVQNSNAGDYEAILKKAAKNPLKFWEEAANNLKWFKKWDEVFSDKEKPFFKWFLGAKCNLAYNALDRHIEEGKINKKTAIIWEEESGRTRKFTYQELYTEVNKLANALRGMGVDRGDRIAIYMPNIPEIVFAMLACAKVGAMHSVLYTSGTTSKPKGVIHVHGGYPVGVLQTMKYVFDIKGDEIFWCTADPGWITGHSYIIYGPLLAGITTLMYEGVPDMPKPDRIWKVVEKYKVNILYTAPTLIRAMMKYGINWPKAHKMESLRLLGSVGEPINPEAWKWFYTYVGKKRCPIMDTWWQTETGMNMITPLPSAPLKAGSACKPFPGIIADVVDKKGKSVPTGKGGFLVIRNQWPSMIRTIFNNPERYIKTYWSEIRGMYFAGDVAAKDKEGYFWIQGRTDDVLKVAGHRIGTAEVESAFVSHKSVVEAAVIGVPDPVKGEVIVAFVILAGKVKPSEELNMEIRKHVRKEIGPVAVIKDIKFIDKLPKTRSGKIMRRVLKAQELGLEVGDTSAMVN